MIFQVARADRLRACKASGFVAIALAMGVLGGCAQANTESDDLGSSLSPYWAAMIESDEGTASSGQASQLIYGDLVAACMKSEGFEYWPVPVPDPESDPSSDVVDGFSVEVATRDVYGIVPPYSDFLPSSEKEGAGQDRNEAYSAKLPPAMFQEYSDALYGTLNERLVSEEDVDNYELDLEDLGCDGKAKLRVEEQHANNTSSSSDRTVTPYDELIYEMGALAESVADAPAAAGLQEAWSRCMEQTGEVYFHWDEPSAFILREYRAILDTVQPREAPEGDVVWIDEDFEDAPDRRAYERLRQAERALAVSDATCQEKIGRDRVESEILDGLEKEFLKRNKRSLDEMAVWFQSQQ